MEESLIFVKSWDETLKFGIILGSDRGWRSRPRVSGLDRVSEGVLSGADMQDQTYRLTVRHKVWLEADDAFALGDGGVELLRAIDATGSIRAGARQVGWSYRHALTYLTQADAALGCTLVARVRGGQQRGGATLTHAGQDLLRRYAAFRATLDRAVEHLSRTAFSGSAP